MVANTEYVNISPNRLRLAADDSLSLLMAKRKLKKTTKQTCLSPVGTATTKVKRGQSDSTRMNSRLIKTGRGLKANIILIYLIDYKFYN